MKSTLNKGENMSSQSEDEEIERIKKIKANKMLEGTRTQAKPIEKPIAKPIVLTDSSFPAEVAKHKLLVVDFWAPWCGPCRMVGPIIEQLATEYAGKVTFGKMNVDENQMIPSQFSVQGIPTLIVFKNGEPVETLVGACPKSHIESKFKPHMEKNA
jgi:thioredoxin 1